MCCECVKSKWKQSLVLWCLLVSVDITSAPHTPPGSLWGGSRGRGWGWGFSSGGLLLSLSALPVPEVLQRRGEARRANLFRRRWSAEQRAELRPSVTRWEKRWVAISSLRGLTDHLKSVSFDCDSVIVHPPPHPSPPTPHTLTTPPPLCVTWGTGEDWTFIKARDWLKSCHLIACCVYCEERWGRWGGGWCWGGGRRGVR